MKPNDTRIFKSNELKFREMLWYNGRMVRDGDMLNILRMCLFCYCRQIQGERKSSVTARKEVLH